MGEGSSVLYAAREPAAKGALVAPLGWSWGRTEESDMLLTMKTASQGHRPQCAFVLAILVH